MRVLYLLANYPQASESYIDAEIAYAQSRGVEVGVWSTTVGYGEVPSGLPVYYGDDPHVAIGDFKPDLLHVHYLVTAEQLFRNLFVNLPVTVRAHSFDWSLARAAHIAAVPNVRAIYAFPHFAREAGAGSKIVPLPVAYDAALYDAPLDKAIRYERVIRLAAGRRMKGLEDFLAVSKRLLPFEGEFVLAVAKIRGDEAYLEKLKADGMNVGTVVTETKRRERAVELTRTAGVYLDTSDPAGHPFGMPISIAEAMASGSIVLIRDCPAAREYAGNVACYYNSVEEAAILVGQALKTDPHERAALAIAAQDRARLFRSDVVLPRLVDDWERFA